MMLSNKKKYHNILTILIIFLVLTPLLVAILPSVTAFAEKPEGAWVDDGVTYDKPNGSGTGFELDVVKMPKIISWVLEIIFLLIACVLWLIGEILNALTRGLIGGYFDVIIMQGSGVSTGTSPIINFYTFRLAEGNIYGVAVSSLYPVIASVVIMMIVVRFFSGMSRAGFSTSSQESRSIAKDTLAGSMIAIFAVVLMPQFYQIGLLVMHKILDIIGNWHISTTSAASDSLNSALGSIVGETGSGLLNFSIQIDADLAWEKAVQNFILMIAETVLIAGSVILTFLMVYEYVMVCLSFSLHFLAFPFRVTVSAAKVKESISEWLKQFYELIMTPVIDVILLKFMTELILAAANVGGANKLEDGQVTGAAIPAAFIAIIIMFAFFPLRKVMRMYMGLNATGAETLSKGVAGNLAKAAFVGKAAAKIARDHHDKKEEAKRSEQSAAAEQEAANNENKFEDKTAGSGAAADMDNPATGGEAPEISSVFDEQQKKAEEATGANMSGAGQNTETAEGADNKPPATESAQTAAGQNVAGQNKEGKTGAEGKSGQGTDLSKKAGAGANDTKTGPGDTKNMPESASQPNTVGDGKNGGEFAGDDVKPAGDDVKSAENITNNDNKNVPDAAASVGAENGPGRKTEGADTAAKNGGTETGKNISKPFDKELEGKKPEQQPESIATQGADESESAISRSAEVGGEIPDEISDVQSAQKKKEDQTEQQTGQKQTGDKKAGADGKNISATAGDRKKDSSVAEEIKDGEHTSSADSATRSAEKADETKKEAPESTKSTAEGTAGADTADTAASTAASTSASKESGTADTSETGGGAEPISISEYRQKLAARKAGLDKQVADSKANLESLGNQERELTARKGELDNAISATKDSYGAQIAEQKRVAASESRKALEASSPAEKKEHEIAAATARENVANLEQARDAQVAGYNSQRLAAMSQMTAVRNMKAAEQGRLAEAQAGQRDIQSDMREADNQAKAAAGTRYVPGSPEQKALHDIAAKHATLANFDTEYKGAFSHEEMAAMYRERAAQTRAAARSGLIKGIAGGVAMGAAGAMLGGGIGLTGGAMAGMNIGSSSADNALNETLNQSNAERNKKAYEKRGHISPQTGNRTFLESNEGMKTTASDGSTIYTTADPIRGARTADGKRGNTIIRSYVKDKDGNLHLREANVINSKVAQSYERASRENLLASRPNTAPSREEKREQGIAARYRADREQRLENIRSAMNFSAARADAGIRAERTSGVQNAFYQRAGSVSEDVNNAGARTEQIIRGNAPAETEYTAPSETPVTPASSVSPEMTPSRYAEEPVHYSAMDTLNYDPDHGDTLPKMAERLCENMYSPSAENESGGIEKLNNYLSSEVKGLIGSHSDQLRDYAAIFGEDSEAYNDVNSYYSAENAEPERVEGVAASVAVSNATLARALSSRLNTMNNNRTIPRDFVYNSEAAGNEKEKQDKIIDRITDGMMGDITAAVRTVESGGKKQSPLHSAVRYERSPNREGQMYKRPYSYVTDVAEKYSANSPEYQRLRDYVKKYSVEAFFRQQEKAVKRINSEEKHKEQMDDLFGKNDE